jgi:Rrf2 family transcriptional regulator, cysteine metabolism repressor
MKISTKGRYGLRAMLDLALNSKVSHVSLLSIAERQGISSSYLEQMFSTLRKADLVKSVKGAQGGYTLIDNPSKIKIGTILRALEGTLSVVDEDNSPGEKINSNFENCIKLNIWDKIDDSINRVVDSLTLEDLMLEYKKLDEIQVDMYYI